MLIWHIIAAGFVPMLALAVPTTNDALDSDSFSCGTRLSEEFQEISKSLAKEEANARKLGRRAIHEVQINVYMHIVASSEDPHDGNLSVGFDLSRLLSSLLSIVFSQCLFYFLLPTAAPSLNTNPATRTKTSLTNSKSSKLTLSRRASSST